MFLHRAFSPKRANQAMLYRSPTTILNNVYHFLYTRLTASLSLHLQFNIRANALEIRAVQIPLCKR
jgi:hypothetical protein